MPTHWAPAPNRYELYLSNEVLWVCVASSSAKLQAVGIQKKSRPFGSEATFFASLYSESLLFKQPGFDSWTVQTLKGYSLAVL